MRMRILNRTLLTVIAIGAMSQTTHAEGMTAFQLIKEGNRYVGEESKDRVVQIRSEKSVGGLAPIIWHIVYYDPDASLKATEVIFGAGKKLSVKRPFRLRNASRDADIGEVVIAAEDGRVLKTDLHINRID